MEGYFVRLSICVYLIVWHRNFVDRRLNARKKDIHGIEGGNGGVVDHVAAMSMAARPYCRQ